MNKIDRVGEKAINNFGNNMTIIDYINNKNCTIKFDNGYICYNKKYEDFKYGKIKSPYCKSIFGIGYIGEGEYNVNIRHESIAFKYWSYMLYRCYSCKMQIKEPTYKGCSVCEEWHNFQNFAKWFYNNFYTIDEEKMQLDKDILFKGNKIYSPKTCVFVSQRINNLFTKCNSRRGDFPLGVSFDKNRNKYSSGCNTYLKNKNKYVNLGRYKTPEEAFYAYKEFKEDYIKQVAEEYKDKIPKKLYDAMYRYEVEITD